jgi:hypothetical protein
MMVVVVMMLMVAMRGGRGGRGEDHKTSQNDAECFNPFSHLRLLVRLLPMEFAPF